MESLEAAGADALRRADEATQQLHSAQACVQQQHDQIAALEARLADSEQEGAAARGRVEALERAAAAGTDEVQRLRARLAAAEEGYYGDYVNPKSSTKHSLSQVAGGSGAPGRGAGAA